MFSIADVLKTHPEMFTSEKCLMQSLCQFLFVILIVFVNSCYLFCREQSVLGGFYVMSKIQNMSVVICTGNFSIK